MNDAGLWTSLSLSMPVNKELEFSVSPEIRLDENLSQVSTFFGDVGVEYELMKYLYTNLTYRIGGRNSGEWIDLRQRYSFGLGLKNTWGDFRAGWLCRMQASRSGTVAESDADFSTALRNKFSFKYTGLKKTDFSTSFETFNAAGAYGTMLLTDWRWQAQVERRIINKRNFVSIGYLIQKDLMSEQPELDYVFLVGYKLEVGWLKEKQGEEAVPSDVVPQ